MELVAPAGNYNALVAAVNNGADAVYLGLPDFGARAKAENFSFENLESAIEYAHLFGTRVFVTLNTLIKDNEMSRAIDCAKHAYACGADAAIVQDVRFIKKLKRELPEFTLHASTQMGIHNADGARAILDMGLRRVVLARETLPQDIAEIKKTGIDIEFFVQGALCICFSGNCYFSSLASSYSGNRGKCMQLCRKKYELRGDKGYYLSAKDICLYDKLAYLNDLGVDAVKIEGRMRSIEYVAQAVRVYKSQMPTDEARKALKAVFNRGNYCSAYLDESAPFRVVYSKSQANIGNYVGKIDRVTNNRVKVNGFTPNPADGFKIMRGGIEVGGASVRGGDVVADCKAKPGDELMRTFDGKLSEELNKINRTLAVTVDVQIDGGKPILGVAKHNDCVYALTGKVAEHAINRALTTEDISKAFKKVSQFPFDVIVNVNTDNTAFMPISELNEFRRNLYTGLVEQIKLANAPKRSHTCDFSLDYNQFQGRGKILCVDDLSVITKDISDRIDYIALKPRDYSDVNRSIGKYSFDKKLLLYMPITMRGDDYGVLRRAVDDKNIFGVISNNYYTLKFTDKPILLGPGHNIIGDCVKTHIRSYESDDIGGDNNSFMYCFGHAQLMTLCHCIYGKCIGCGGDDILTDDEGRKFSLKRYKIAHCYWELNNYVPHNFTDRITCADKNLYYDCCGMNAADILCVLNGEYKGKYTRGNTNKGLK